MPFLTDHFCSCVCVCQKHLKRRSGDVYLNTCMIRHTRSIFVLPHTDCFLCWPTIWERMCVCVRARARVCKYNQIFISGRPPARAPVKEPQIHQTDRQTERWTDKQIDRQTERWTERQRDREKDTQTDRQTDRQTERQREKSDTHSRLKLGVSCVIFQRFPESR